MATGATIASILTGLQAAYQSITLPSGLGAPTAFTRQLDGSSTVPFVELYRNPARNINADDTNSYKVTRVFVARLYIARLDDSAPSLTNDDYVKADACIETVEDYFYFTDDRLGVAFVTNHIVSADTAGTLLTTRDNRNYAGVAFEHSVEYLRMR